MKYVAVCLICVATVAAQAGQTAPGWVVTQVAGPLAMPAQKVTLAMDKEKLTFSHAKAGRLEIPLIQVTRTVYSSTRFNRAQQMMGDKYGNRDVPLPDTSTNCWQPGCAGGGLMMLGTLLAASTMHGATHYFTVTWLDRGVEQQTEFDAGKSDWEAIALQLREQLGDRWIEVGKEQAKFEAMAKAHHIDVLSIDLEHDSWCGELNLPRGSYRLLPLERESESVVYVFAGEVSYSQFRGIVPAHVTEDAGAKGIEYAKDGEKITSLTANGKRFVFTGE